jgi:hypothetical protein
MRQRRPGQAGATQMPRFSTSHRSGIARTCRYWHPFRAKHTHGETHLEPVLHPLASHDLPYFITAPGETDRMMVMTGIFLLLIIISVGVLYFSLHSLPERLSHRTNQVQAGVVAVLCLLALFTHNHVFWIIAILLAFIRIPDFETPIYSISDSLQRLAQSTPPSAPVAEVAAPVIVDSAPAPVAEADPPSETPAPDVGKREG